MKYLKILLYLVALAVIVASLRTCVNQAKRELKPDYQGDSLRFENIKIRIENDFLIQANRELDSLKTPRLETIYQTREVIKYIRLKPDSIRLTDSSYCRLLETENTNLWYIVGLDSQYIVNQKSIISGLNKVIVNDSTMLSGCEIEWRKQAENARKSEMMANKAVRNKNGWRMAAIIKALLLVYKSIK